MEQQFEKWNSKNVTWTFVDMEPTYATEYEMIDFIQMAHPGMHICVPFRNKNPLSKDGILFHHGLYIGDRMVIDNNDRQPSIKRIEIRDFFAINNVNHSFYIIHYSNQEEEDKKHAIEFAEYAVNLPCNTETKLYNLWNFNCEGFVSLCLTGKNRFVMFLVDDLFIFFPMYNMANNLIHSMEFAKGLRPYNPV